MIRTRHRLLACIAAVVALAVAAEASATSLLVLDYNNAKTFGAVHIANGAIDLTGGAMVVTTSSFGFVPSGGQSNEYGSPGVAEYGDAAIHDALAEGGNFSSGFWNGTNGIISFAGSSSAANDPAGLTTVGWVDNSITTYSTFEGIPVNASQSIIATTWFGDALLNGFVTAGNDYGIFFNSSTSPGGTIGSITGGPPEWVDAAWDQQGAVTAGGDYSLYFNSVTGAQYDRGFSPSAPIVPMQSATAVPEPATAALLVAVFPALLLVNRLRRRSA